MRFFRICNSESLYGLTFVFFLKKGDEEHQQEQATVFEVDLIWLSMNGLIYWTMKTDVVVRFQFVSEVK